MMVPLCYKCKLSIGDSVGSEYDLCQICWEGLAASEPTVAKPALDQCATCRQPVLTRERHVLIAGNGGAHHPEHVRAADCVAATVRNCEALAREHLGYYAAYGIRKAYLSVFEGPTEPKDVKK